MIFNLLRLYNSLGRFGNIILLALLIIFGITNRTYLAIHYRDFDYTIEVILILLAAFLTYKIYKKNLFSYNKKKIFHILLIAGILLRISLAVHDFINRPVQDSDYSKHERLGERLAVDGRFIDNAFGVELRNFRQPGLPAIFAVGLLIYNSPVTYAAIMIMFSFATLIAGFFLFKNQTNLASVFTFGYLCISPNMFFMASNSNTQLPFFFFVILLFIILKYYTGKTYQLIIIGAILAAEMYIRMNFLMIFLLIPFIIEKHKDYNISYSLGKLGLIYLSCLIFYSPWIYRNYMIYDTIRLMPTTGLGLYSSNVTDDPTQLGDYNGIPDSLIFKYNKLPEVEFDNALKKEAIDFVKNNPDVYLKGMPYKFIKYSGRQDWTISYFFQFTQYPNGEQIKICFQTIENFFFWIILFYPLIFLIKHKRLAPLPIYILWAYLSYSIILLPLSETRSRYNFPYILFPIFAVALSPNRDENFIKKA